VIENGRSAAVSDARVSKECRNPLHFIHVLADWSNRPAIVLPRNVAGGGHARDAATFALTCDDGGLGPVDRAEWRRLR
jgi:hypothetical protein